MTDKQEYKFSWTRKVGEGFHNAKGDTVEEVIEGMDALEARILEKGTPIPPKVQEQEKPRETASSPANIGGSTGPTEVKNYCDMHQVEMKKNKNGKYYHREFVAGQGARFCNGFGYGEWIK